MIYVCPQCCGSGLSIDTNEKCDLCHGQKTIVLQPAEVEVKVRYHTPDLIRMEKIEKGDWIDLRAAQDVVLEKGKQHLIPLGISVQLPENFEAHVVPRSGAYKNFKIIQTNSTGIIDESYCGNDDQWMMPVYAFEDGRIEKNDRICQFKIVKKMPPIRFTEVDKLTNQNRNGFSSTGVK